MTCKALIIDYKILDFQTKLGSDAVGITLGKETKFAIIYDLNKLNRKVEIFKLKTSD